MPGSAISTPYQGRPRPLWGRRLRLWLVANWDGLGVLLLMVCTFPPTLLSPHSPVIVVTSEPTDYSWKLDTCFKAAQGVWLGRDVIFTFGPLYQWLSSTPARWLGTSMGTASATWNLLPLWCTFLAMYLALRLLMAEQPPWRRFLLLLLLAAWAPMGAADLRIFLGVLIFSLLLIGSYAVAEGRLRPWLAGLSAAIFSVLGFLYSADTGAYALMAWLACLAGVLWEYRFQPQVRGRYAKALLVFVFAGFALMVAANSVLARPLDFRFWKNALLIIRTQRWTLPMALTSGGTAIVLGAVLAATAVFLVAARHPASDGNLTRRAGFLAGSYLFCLLVLQRALVRSDRYHISGGVFPWLFFSAVILFSFRSRLLPAAAALATIPLWLLSPRLPLLPQSTFNPLQVAASLRQALHPLDHCPASLDEFDGACYWPIWAADLRAASDFLRQHSATGDPAVIFPYHTYYVFGAGREVAGGILLSYLVTGERLFRLDLAGLEPGNSSLLHPAPFGRTHQGQAGNLPSAGIYISDSEPDFAVDKISNFTRSPELWFWLFRNYRSPAQLRPNMFGLIRDSSRPARLSFQVWPLSAESRTEPITQRNTTIDLGPVAWPADGADFLRLRLTVRYNPLWQLRKPAHLELEITRADGAREIKPFVIEPNVTSDVWFYPWNELDLPNYFAGDEAQWRPHWRAPVTHLRLRIAPLDWFSQAPDSLRLEVIDAVAAHLTQPAGSKY